MQNDIGNDLTIGSYYDTDKPTGGVSIVNRHNNNTGGHDNAAFNVNRQLLCRAAARFSPIAASERGLVLDAGSEAEPAPDGPSSHFMRRAIS